MFIPLRSTYNIKLQSGLCLHHIRYNWLFLKFHLTNCITGIPTQYDDSSSEAFTRLAFEFHVLHRHQLFNCTQVVGIQSLHIYRQGSGVLAFRSAWYTTALSRTRAYPSVSSTVLPCLTQLGVILKGLSPNQPTFTQRISHSGALY